MLPFELPNHCPTHVSISAPCLCTAQERYFIAWALVLTIRLAYAVCPSLSLSFVVSLPLFASAGVAAYKPHPPLQAFGVATDLLSSGSGVLATSTATIFRLATAQAKLQSCSEKMAPCTVARAQIIASGVDLADRSATSNSRGTLSNSLAPGASAIMTTTTCHWHTKMGILQ